MKEGLKLTSTTEFNTKNFQVRYLKKNYIAQNVIAPCSLTYFSIFFFFFIITLVQTVINNRRKKLSVKLHQAFCRKVPDLITARGFGRRIKNLASSYIFLK